MSWQDRSYCPDGPLEPAEPRRDLVECCWCHEAVGRGETTLFSNGERVCGDCLKDYLADAGSEYYQEYAESQQDFPRWWFQEYLTAGAQEAAMQRMLEELPFGEQCAAQAAFASACGWNFLDTVKDRLGGYSHLGE